MKTRLIPRLDIKGPNVVKGIHMEGLRVLGKPKDLARKYYEQGADELIAMDIVVSLYERSPDFDLMRGIADELFIPLTMGGGIKSIDDINAFLRAGADKVAINTHAIRNPKLLPEAVRQFGSQCIVLSVEAKWVPGPAPLRSAGLPAVAPPQENALLALGQSYGVQPSRGEGWYEAYTDGGREHSGKDAIEWIKQGIDLGVGEILLTSVDYDGTKKGYDLDLIRAVTSFAPVPVVVHGGAKDAASLKEALDCKADAIAMASILHYDNTTIDSLKKELATAGVPIRKS